MMASENRSTALLRAFPRTSSAEMEPLSARVRSPEVRPGFPLLYVPSSVRSDVAMRPSTLPRGIDLDGHGTTRHSVRGLRPGRGGVWNARRALLSSQVGVGRSEGGDKSPLYLTLCRRRLLAVMLAAGLLPLAGGGLLVGFGLCSP